MLTLQSFYRYNKDTSDENTSRYKKRLILHIDGADVDEGAKVNSRKPGKAATTPRREYGAYRNPLRSCDSPDSVHFTRPPNNPIFFLDVWAWVMWDGWIDGGGCLCVFWFAFTKYVRVCIHLLYVSVCVHIHISIYASVSIGVCFEMSVFFNSYTYAPECLYV